MNAACFDARVVANEPVDGNIMLLRVVWDSATPAPRAGQFYMLRAWHAEEAPLLSRPISVHAFDAEKQEILFLYEIKGMGTQKLAALKEGGTVRLTGPSGNGFPGADVLGARVALVGGGIGIAPLLQLAVELTAQGAQVDLYAGFRDIPYRLAAFEAVCTAVHIATDTGSVGHKGFVTDLLDPTRYTAVCACGPEIMMQKTARMAMRAQTPVYVSKEAKMACGVGACLGCTCKSKNGGVSVCKDGPVLEGSIVYGLD